MVSTGFNSRLHFCFFFSITRLRIDLGWQFQLQLFDLPHECWNVGDSSAGPKMAAGSADQTWRLAVPGSAGQCQKKKKISKKKNPKKRFCFQKKWWISKKLPFLPFLRVFKAFNIAIMSQNEPKWDKNGREPLQNVFFRKRCARHGRSCWAIF